MRILVLVGLLSLALGSVDVFAADDAASSATVGTVSVDQSKIETSEKGSSSWGSLAGNLALTSDYIFRGQSQTGHNPAAQGEIDYTHPSGIYLGVWGSNVKFQDANTPA